MTPVVVTGARGQVGRAVVAAALEGGRSVTALSRSGPDPEPLPPGLTWRRWSIEQPEAVHDVLHGSVVVHAAAHLPARFADPAEAERCVQVNALGTLAVLRACHGAEAAAVVITSGNLYASSTAAADERTPLQPLARAPYYLGSKLLADEWARAWATRLAVSVLRIGSVYGPHTPRRSLVPALLDRLGAGEPATVTDGGRYAVDLVHAADVAWACLAAGDGPPDVYNVGSGQVRTTFDVAQAVLKATGADPALLTVEPARPGPPDLGFCALDVSRARRVWGYAPRSLEDGVAQIWADRLAGASVTGPPSG